MNMKGGVTNGNTDLNYKKINRLIQEHGAKKSKYQSFWEFYRNSIDNNIQKRHLPKRFFSGNEIAKNKEIVIENDISWRLHAMVDFMFSKAVVIQSLAKDANRANEIEHFLKTIFVENGGTSFFQDMALLGAIYGFVDVLVRVDSSNSIILEIMDPKRTVPIVNDTDYRLLDGYIITQCNEFNIDRISIFNRFVNSIKNTNKQIDDCQNVYLLSSKFLDTYSSSNKEISKTSLVCREINKIGVVPIVHIQNLSQPFFYEGLSEVEALIPLQNELNTRLSDRANRVTFQSFKMYLGKGIEKFVERPVGPGQMWATENLDASIEEFGGDKSTPSEESHILEIREAMDKASGVSPLVTGIVRDKIGNLTSENALRIVMMGLVAKTEKKRVSYGEGIKKLCAMILHYADMTGIFPNTIDERNTRLDWPESMPVGETQRLINAEKKIKIGISQKQVLAELGYGSTESTA